MYSRHKLTRTALQDLLTLVNIMVPGCAPETKYFLERYFFSPDGCSNVTVHFYCPECNSYLGPQSNDDQIFVCDYCDNDDEDDGDREGNSASQLLTMGKYLLVSPIKDQIKDFLENRNLAALLFSDSPDRLTTGIYGDIATGECYNSQSVQSFLNESPYNFTMTFNSDGTKLFESSSRSLWSLLCTFNELPYNERSEFVILSTLSCDEAKPPTDAFLRLFVEETIELRFQGFKWTDSTGISRLSKIMFLVCVADAPARCMFSNLTQYNGEFGCGHCLNPGVRARTGKGGGSMQAFPLVSPLHPDREEESMLLDVEKAIETGSPVNGVKGPSLLYRIPGFNVANGIVPEVMHCTFLGINRQFLSLWKSERSKGFYVKDLDKHLDSTISFVRPPDDLPRVVRSLVRHGRNWKANEHKPFLLFYSPIALRTLLKPVYYKHWLLLVNAFILLLREEATEKDVETAEFLIYKFVFDTKKHYGLKAVKYNVHLLIHFANTVRKYGLPWAYSAFLFEGVGGLLKNLFHGSKHVTKQIFENFLVIGRLRDFARYYIPNCEQPLVKKLYERLDGKISLEGGMRKAIVIAQTLGVGSNHLLNEVYLISLSLKIGFDLPRTCFTFHSYTRCVFKNKKYCTAMYCAGKKRNNSLVQLKSGKIVRINWILKCVRDCECPANEPRHHPACLASNDVLFGKENANGLYFFGTKVKLNSLPPCREPFANNIDLTSFMKQLDESGYNGIRRRLIVFDASDIAYKCLLIPDRYGRQFCVVNKIVFEGS